MLITRSKVLLPPDDAGQDLLAQEGNLILERKTAQERREMTEIAQQKEEEEGAWCQLPRELLSLISSHLLVMDAGAIAAIRLTCKPWHLIDSIPRNPIQPSPPVQKSGHKYPYLMSLVGSTCKFFHPIQNHTFDMNIPELLGASILFSKHGWLLLYGKDNSVFFFNPFEKEKSKQKITLPQPPIYFLRMSFSSVPTSRDCYVVGFAWLPHQIGIIKSGEEEWTTCNYSEKFSPYSNPVIHNDQCYCLAWDGHVGVFDIKHNSFSIIGRQFPVREQGNPFLLANKGVLLAVLATCEGVHVKGFSLKGSHLKKVWQSIQKLSDQMLFVRHAASFVRATIERGTSNKVYFPKVREDNCIFYSLSTSKYHSFLGDYSRRTPYSYCIKEVSNCTWIDSIC